MEYSNLVSRFIRDSKRFYARILAIVEHGEEGGDEASADELKTALNIPFIFGISLWFAKWARSHTMNRTEASRGKSRREKKTNDNKRGKKHLAVGLVQYSLS